MKRSRYIVVVGCGRVGSHLANQLSRDGNSIVVVDSNERMFESLSADFSGFRVHGDATHLAVLQETRLMQADALIATTHEDNVNVMVAQIAQKVFHVPHVMARVFDPKREDVYRQLGIETICPTTVAAGMFLRAVLDTAPSAHGERS